MESDEQVNNTHTNVYTLLFFSNLFPSGRRGFPHAHNSYIVVLYCSYKFVLFIRWSSPQCAMDLCTHSTLELPLVYISHS